MSTASRRSTGSNKSSSQKILRRCGDCAGCMKDDCGQCEECKGKKKFGGPGTSKQACINRRCEVVEQRKKERKKNSKRRGRSSSRGGEGGGSQSRGRSRDLIDDSTSRHSSSKKPRRRGSDHSTTSSSRLSRSAVAATTTGTTSARDHLPSGSKRASTGPKDPLVLQLEEAFPDPPPSLLVMEQSLAKASQKTNNPTTANLHEFKYGMRVPPPVVDVCAGCRRAQAPPSDTNEEPVILLCDGPGCQSEYHLECCVPPISEVPSGEYYCIDCSPHGSASTLMQYLEEHEERRANYTTNHNSSSFLHQLWREDLQDNETNWVDEKTNNDQESYQRVPQSELYRMYDLQRQLKGPKSIPPTTESLCLLMQGKPIRLYCPLDDNYHSGRIVDYRLIPLNLSSISSRGKQQSSKPIYTHSSTPNDEFFAHHVEFFVRFLPGTDEYRKVPVQHWMRLEEHSLAIGTHLIWGKFDSGIEPAIVFLRTSRELMPVLHLLQESEGEISYHPLSIMNTNSSGNMKHPAIPPKKQAPKKLWGLAKRFGSNTSKPSVVDTTLKDHNKDPPINDDFATTKLNSKQQNATEAYRLLSIADEARDFCSQKQKTPTHIDQLKYSMALAEHREQQRCVQWKGLPQKNPWHPQALTSRDEYTLGPLPFVDAKPSKEEHELCPLIRAPGLDRYHLVKTLELRGIVQEATKDIAAGIKCTLIL